MVAAYCFSFKKIYLIIDDVSIFYGKHKTYLRIKTFISIIAFWHKWVIWK
jgi:hypothetical protein